MTKETKFVDKITRIERYRGYTGHNGNPRWTVYFQDHDSAPTGVDASVGYGINNAAYRQNRVEVTLDGRGNVIYLRVINDLENELVNGPLHIERTVMKK